MLDFYFIIAFTFFLEAIQVGSADNCQYGNYGYGYYNSKYCEYGCCGSNYNDVCCGDRSFQMEKERAGIIAGAVIGSLTGLFVLIVLIVALCVTANNSKRRTGALIQPPNTTTQTSAVRNMGVTQGQGPPNNPDFYGPVGGPYGPVGYDYSDSFLPPAYSQYNNVPQGGTDPAYPPLPPPPQAAKY